ncbi:MAG: alpha/beta hydrolase [Actinomycetota bacterium]|nr:alpha/beta hydrolase [Actinomycetota bacterium]
MRALERDGGPTEGEPVLLVHGNVSSSLFFVDLINALPERFRPIAPDLRGYGGTDPLPIDASRGLRDWADDVLALADALDLPTFHLLGWSMGGGVAMQVLLQAPERLRTLTLQAPVSPYGFGGTRGEDGEMLSPDGAGSGGGCANPRFVELLAAGDTGTEDQTSPRNVLRAFYVAPGTHLEREDLYVESMLTTRTGEDHYPGDHTTSSSWPGVAPGKRGILNTMAPTVCRLDGIVDVDPKPPILWIRGNKDAIVSNKSMFDLAQLGAMGAVPGWPGANECPPQPMITQTRVVLDRYRSNGGDYTERVLDGVGHSPHIEAPGEYTEALLKHLSLGTS